MLTTVSNVSAGASRVLPWPKRWDIALLCFFAQVLGYCDRVNISVAAPALMRERHWDTVQMGWVFTAFFIGYTLSMIPIGICIDRYGPKLLLTVGVTWWSIFTALTPIPRKFLAMSVTRCAMGVGESGILPATNAMLVRWFPREEYSRASGLCWSGGYADLSSLSRSRPRSVHYGDGAVSFTLLRVSASC